MRSETLIYSKLPIFDLKYEHILAPSVGLMSKYSILVPQKASESLLTAEEGFFLIPLPKIHTSHQYLEDLE